jgi:hypothetical protein
MNHGRVIAHADAAGSLVSANRIRECPSCRQAFTSTFEMPVTWWEEYGRNANGFFGSATATNEHDGALTMSKFPCTAPEIMSIDSHREASWLHCQGKELRSPSEYGWYKINVFVQWLSSPQQTRVVIFDAPKALESQMPALLDRFGCEAMADPFWIYPILFEQIVQLQDTTVWTARNWIRTLEKSRGASSNVHTDFSGLHDVSRHVIHVTEMLDLCLGVVKHTRQRHRVYLSGAEGVQPTQMNASKMINGQLQFFETMLENLGYRSLSNKERLNNEIQLSFHMVTQVNAELSLQISRSARTDGTLMKTVAVLTLVFLPATFLSAVFSMSFFSYEAGEEWKMSSSIWIYFAWAIPVTLLTTGLWFWWQKSLSSAIEGTDGKEFNEKASMN